MSEMLRKFLAKRYATFMYCLHLTLTRTLCVIREIGKDVVEIYEDLRCIVTMILNWNASQLNRFINMQRLDSDGEFLYRIYT